MKHLLLICLAISLPLLAATPPHAIYLATIQGEISRTEAKLSLKVFADDWRDALRNRFPGEQALPASPRLCEAFAPLMERYLAEHLSLKLDQQALTFSLQSCELLTDVYVLSCSAPVDNPAWKLAEIRADLLMELFPTQTNVVQLKRGQDGSPRLFRLTKEQPEERLTFSE
jgi:hypothetical protein